MIGSVISPVSFASPQDNPDGSIIPGTLYGYDPALYSYVSVDSIHPGRGYWIASAQLCVLSLGSVRAGGNHRRETADSPRLLEDATWLAHISVEAADEVLRRELVFGCHSDATDGFDPTLDTPVPPASVARALVDAVFEVDHSHFSRLSTDLRSGHSSETWLIRASSSEGFDLRWSPEELPEGELWLVPSLGGPAVDMRRTEALAHHESGDTSFEIRYTRSDGGTPDDELEVARLALLPAHPNPSGQSVSISYDLPHESPLTLSIYDASGRLLRSLVDATMPAGRHTAQWDGITGSGDEVSSGVYFCRLAARGRVLTRRLVWIR